MCILINWLVYLTSIDHVSIWCKTPQTVVNIKYIIINLLAFLCLGSRTEEVAQRCCMWYKLCHTSTTSQPETSAATPGGIREHQYIHNQKICVTSKGSAESRVLILLAYFNTLPDLSLTHMTCSRHITIYTMQIKCTFFM